MDYLMLGLYSQIFIFGTVLLQESIDHRHTHQTVAKKEIRFGVAACPRTDSAHPFNIVHLAKKLKPDFIELKTVCDRERRQYDCLLYTSGCGGWFV